MGGIPRLGKRGRLVERNDSEGVWVEHPGRGRGEQGYCEAGEENRIVQFYLFHPKVIICGK